MYQALYRKYRPQTLNDICGQDVIVKTISNSINNKKINHAYLFAGPRGTGKTSIAKIFARMVNCEKLKDNVPCGKCPSCSQIINNDIIEIDAASNNGVDEIRELKNKVNLVPAHGKFKVYIIDEVHMLTTGAFNALLKTLEEPPEHIIFILATTDPHKIPETILSRCQRFDFKKVTEGNIINRLETISKKEKILIDRTALEEIARISDGGMRDSIGLLDQAAAYSDKKITEEDIHKINGTITPKEIKELLALIIDKNLEQIFHKLDYYNNSGKSFVKLTEEIIVFLRNVLICKEAPNYFKENNNNEKMYKEIIAKVDTENIVETIEILNETLSKMKTTNNPKLLLELAVIQITGKNDKQNPKVDDQHNHKVYQNITPKNNEEKRKIIKNEKVSTQDAKNITKITEKTSLVDKDKLKELQKVRINNTLAGFQKKILIELKEELNTLNKILLNPEYSKYASIILDGNLKAASENNLIYVYQNERLSDLFNENITKIEKTIKTAINKNYKVIATDTNSWEKIKNDFNSKKKVYNYKEETISLDDIFKEVQNELSEFEDIIEYK